MTSYYWRMLLWKPVRVLSTALALLSGLSVPGTALAHGITHAREALEAHQSERAHDHESSAGAEIAEADHDHVQIDALPGSRVILSLEFVVVAVTIAGFASGSETSFEYPVPDEVPRVEAASKLRPLPRSPPFIA